MRILVTGAGGFIGRHVLAAIDSAGHRPIISQRPASQSPPVAPGGCEAVSLDLEDTSSIRAAVASSNPDAVIHLAADADIRSCERDPERARRINTVAAGEVASAACGLGARLVLVSTDQVFDGEGPPYGEDAWANPIHVYGRSKLEAERVASERCGNVVVARLALTYGRSGSARLSASDQVCAALETGTTIELFTDEVRSPIFAGDAAGALLELAVMPSPPRLVHLGGPEAVSRYGLGVAIASARGLDAGLIRPLRQGDVKLEPRRPRDLSLDVSLSSRMLTTRIGPVAERVQHV